MTATALRATRTPESLRSRPIGLAAAAVLLLVMVVLSLALGARLVGEALGRTAEAQAVLDEVDAVLAEKAAENPELEGKTVAVVWDVSGTFYVYKPADSRVSFLFDLGPVNAPSVDELANGESPFYFTLSYEELDKLESDIVVAFSNTKEEADAFLAQSYAQTIPAVKAGAVASVSGVELVAAVSPPTALSLTWGIDEYVAALAQAASATE